MIPARLKQPAALAIFVLGGLHCVSHARASDVPAVQKPTIVDFRACAKPVWPREALRREHQGTVTMEFRIEADGSVAESRVIKSSGSPLLDEAARFGLAKCKFKPGTPKAKAKPVWLKMQYVWTLSEPAPPEQKALFAETRAAAEAGDVAAQLKVGEFYQSGKGVKRDDAQAYTWLKQAAEAGNAEAQLRLAYMRRSGSGVEVDAADAHQWALKAAEQGHARAMFLLASNYMTASGVRKDEVQAAAWLRTAADAGLPEAFAALGSLYETGRGVDRNPDEAHSLLRRGVELGDTMAQLRLGMELYRSQSPRDQAEAAALLEKAAKKGYPKGQAMLGHAYRDGKGVTADAATAAEWYRKAAAQSEAAAQHALAELLEQGSGVVKDEAEALRLYELAARRGWQPAVLRMMTVAERGELGRPVDVAAVANWRARLSSASATK